MKKRILVILVVLAALLLVGFRYAVVERTDMLPDEVRTSLERFFGVAWAETEALVPFETPAPTLMPTQTPAPTPTPLPEARLERGDSGDDVKALQERLRELGFLTGAADGKFGPQTEKAVEAFKEHLYRMEQEQAEAERLAEEQALSEQTEENAADATVEPTEENADYTAVTPAEGNAANGTVAPTEEDADHAADLTAEEDSTEPAFDGKVDDETYRLIVERGFDEYQVKLQKGMRGAEVERLQNRLKTLGYLTGKADGIFGNQTVNAVIAFQKRHQLTQDGIAGEKTQRALFDSAAKKQVQQAQQTKGKPYLLKVSTEKQRVYAYSWSETDKAYTKLVRTMVCSTGLASTPTPKGTYTSTTTPVVRWGYFPKYDVWAQYLYRIQGPYLFHSVLYDEADESTVKWGSVNKLGTPASHGCIRLSVEDARWIYNNCPAGTTVTVY